MKEDLMYTKRHEKKFHSFVYPEVIKLKNPTILEFGVSEKAFSTEKFIEICKLNQGKLFSVDQNDYSNKFDYEYWKFIKSRDDNFELIDRYIPKELDVIYLDTLHKANHVEKMIYHYYKYLKVGGFFFIDDTSWLPYTVNREKNHFFKEVNNYLTFKKLLNIYNNNEENMEIDFTFTGTGVTKIKKLKSENLKEVKHIIKNRLYSLKYIIYHFYEKFFK